MAYFSTPPSKSRVSPGCSAGIGVPLIVIVPTLVEARLRTGLFSCLLRMSTREVRLLITSPAAGIDTCPIVAWTNPAALLAACLPCRRESCFPDHVYWTFERLTSPGTEAALIVFVLVRPPVPSQGMEVWLTPPKDSRSPTFRVSADIVVRKTPDGTGSLIRLVARPSSITVLDPSTGLSTSILRA